MTGSATVASVLGLVLILATSHFSVGEPRGSRKTIFSNLNETTSATHREGKVFSLFNVVQFKNEGCRSTSTISSGGTGSSNRNGTCYTSTECTTRGGSAAGSCASGFGVCCVFLISSSGATVSQNCSYLRNPGFPNAYAETSQVSYTIQKCDSSVCRLRLDFESFSLLGTGNTEEFLDPNPGGQCRDMFTVSSNTGNTLPTICGQNTGQHIYVEMGCLDSDTVSVNLNIDGSTAVRMWEIKVTQVKCNTEGQPRNCGCLQYHTGLTGRLTTFNFLPTNDNHLAKQEYSICIRQEAGMCCVEYTVCADASSYSLEAKNDDGTNMQDSNCSKDYVGIEGGSATCNASPGDVLFTQFCGNVFTTDEAATMNMPICDCTKPFRVDIFTDEDTDEAEATANEKHSRGLCLEYRQIPC
ncbi:uncharacterized protein LOC131893072 isoform X2 [Tigriopus californicus]|nr:uncharacterized protein LOC131893072 isoform X2 [Tigriopus californicus]